MLREAELHNDNFFVGADPRVRPGAKAGGTRGCPPTANRSQVELGNAICRQAVIGVWVDPGARLLPLEAISKPYFQPLWWNNRDA